jgi:hypothetical protein
VKDGGAKKVLKDNKRRTLNVQHRTSNGKVLKTLNWEMQEYLKKRDPQARCCRIAVAAFVIDNLK